MLYCFIIGCQNGKQKFCPRPTGVFPENPQKKIVFFKPPKDEVLRNTWVNSIPNNGKELKVSSYVCDEHFLEHDIIKYSETVINGSIHRLQWERWKLKSGAFPQIFPLSTEVNPMQQRKPPLARNPLGTITNNYQGHCPSQMKRGVIKVKAKAVLDRRQAQDKPLEFPVIVDEDHNEEAADVEIERNVAVFDAAVEDDYSTFTEEKIKNIKLPSTSWKMGQLEDGCINAFQIEEKPKSVAIQKLLSIDFKKRIFSQTILNREWTNIRENANNFTSIGEIEAVLLKLHSTRICPGIMQDPEKHLTTETLVRNRKLHLGIWRSHKCSLVVSEHGKIKHCQSCKLLNNSLRMQFKRRKAIKLHSTVNDKYLSIKQLSRKVVEKAKREAQLKFQLKKKKEEVMVAY